MPSCSGGSGGWGPGPGPGPGGGGGVGRTVSANPAINIAWALVNIAQRTIVRSQALSRPIATSANTRQLTGTASAALRSAAERPASAAARDAVCARQFSTSAISRAPATQLQRRQSSRASLQTRHISFKTMREHAGPTFTFASLAAAAVTLQNCREDGHDRRREERNGRRPHFTFRGSTRPSLGGHLPINQTQQIHGPGLQLARNFSTGGPKTAHAAQESVSLVVRMLFEDERKRRRQGSNGARHSGAAAARTPARSNREDRTPSLSQDAREESSIIDFSAEHEHYFQPQEPQSQSDNCEGTHVGEDVPDPMSTIRDELNRDGPLAPDVVTVLRLPSEPVSVDLFNLLFKVPSKVPPDRDGRNPGGGFLGDINLDGHRALVQLSLYVVSAVRAVMVASPQPIAPAVDIRLNGHRKADVMHSLSRLVMLRAQKEGHQHFLLEDGRQLQLVSDDIATVLCELLREEGSDLITRAEAAPNGPAMMHSNTNSGFPPTVRPGSAETPESALAQSSGIGSVQLQFPHAPDSLHSEATRPQDEDPGDDSDASSSSSGFLSASSSIDAMSEPEEGNWDMLRSPSPSSEASPPSTRAGTGSSLRDSRL